MRVHLVLSIFPGIDLLGRAFEQLGYCVVRGPDPLWGGDVRTFHPPRDLWDGVIGGPPCQDFSSARRSSPSGEGDELLAEFARVVTESKPAWWLLENVPRVPHLALNGYLVQRIDVRGSEVGLPQRRLRHFQFGHRRTHLLVVERHKTADEVEPAALATEGARPGRRDWPAFCALQGLPPLELPGMTRSARYRAVGNGVPLPMGLLLARAIQAWERGETAERLCECGCARPVTGRQRSAGPGCRKRLERRRRGTGRLRVVTQQAARSPGQSP